MGELGFADPNYLETAELAEHSESLNPQGSEPGNQVLRPFLTAYDSAEGGPTRALVALSPYLLN